MIRVSTIIPVYNGEATVRETIDSALVQDFRDHEVVVVNDGSTDSTAAILNDYAGRIKVITKENAGPAVGRNIGARAAAGEYLAFLDADDIWLPSKLRKSVEALDGDREAVLAFSDFSRIASDGAVVQESAMAGAPDCVRDPSLENILDGYAILQLSSVVMRKRVFDRVGGFCEQFRLGYEDWLLPLVAREQGRFLYVPEQLTRYRVSPSQGGPGYLRFYPDANIFVRLVSRRYRRSTRELRKVFIRPFAPVFFIKALQCLDAGERLEALEHCFMAMRCWPSYPFRSIRRKGVLGRSRERLVQLVRF